MKKFTFFPESTGFLTACVLAVVAIVFIVERATEGAIKIVPAIFYITLALLLSFVVWDVVVYVVAWPQLSRDEFRRFRESRRSLLQLFS